jgi:lycopene cyclase domain-containing protein
VSGVPGYTWSSLLACAVVLVLEVALLRTGTLRRFTYWNAYAIVLFFQVVVDGWLTKLSAPIVLYVSEHFSDVRFPWDVPVEDYAFGWAMCTLTILLWDRQADETDAEPAPAAVLGPLRRTLADR